MNDTSTHVISFPLAVTNAFASQGGSLSLLLTKLLAKCFLPQKNYRRLNVVSFTFTGWWAPITTKETCAYMTKVSYKHGEIINTDGGYLQYHNYSQHFPSRLDRLLRLSRLYYNTVFLSLIYKYVKIKIYKIIISFVVLYGHETRSLAVRKI